MLNFKPASPLLLLIILSACGTKEGGFPSLERRSYEADAPIFAPTESAAALSVLPGEFAAKSDALQALLAELEFAAVRTHADTLRILELMHWQHRLRLTVSHFLSLPGIVHSSDLAVLMPRNFAQGFAVAGALDVIEPDLPLRDFTVSMHWSQRFDKDPCLQWLRATVAQLFSTSPK
jgi:DNA-binding transcriptional LysR family regulator